MNVLVIFTGGTIGSTAVNGYVTTDGNKPYKLIELYGQKTDSDVIFDTICPYETLSEDMTCKNLFILVKTIREELCKKYDGIIVTHGTDTIQYTAATLSYTLGCETIPVVLVSSNYVLEDKRANGLNNFYYAVEFIRAKMGRGVFVSYQNTGDIPKIHRASRLLEHPVYSDDINSLGDIFYGSFSGDKYIPNPEYLKSVKKSDDVIFDIPSDKWDSDILFIRPYPGKRYPMIDKDIKGVIHHTYHSGTICSKTPGLDTFSKKASDYNIPVFMTGTGKGSDYESTKIYKELGFHKLPYASPVSMYIKLWLAVNRGVSVIETMNKCISEDFLTELH